MRKRRFGAFVSASGIDPGNPACHQPGHITDVLSSISAPLVAFLVPRKVDISNIIQPLCCPNFLAHPGDRGPRWIQDQNDTKSYTVIIWCANFIPTEPPCCIVLYFSCKPFLFMTTLNFQWFFKVFKKLKTYWEWHMSSRIRTFLAQQMIPYLSLIYDESRQHV